MGILFVIGNISYSTDLREVTEKTITDHMIDVLYKILTTYDALRC